MKIIIENGEDSMEHEQYLIGQIEAYIDQLDLLKMQSYFDQERYNSVIDTTVQLIEEYYEALNVRTEQNIQEVECRWVVTLEEEYQKRQDIYLIAHTKESALDDLLIDSSHAPELRERTQHLFDKVHQEAAMYQGNCELVNEQLDAVRVADTKESNLEAEKIMLEVEISMMRNSQVSYQDLDREISEVYHQFMENNQIDGLDLQVLRSKKKILQQRQTQLQENLMLAQKVKEDAAGYQMAYEGKLKQNRLEIDKIDEQIFVFLAAKIMGSPVTSYEDLRKRTSSLETLIASRKQVVENLYITNVVSKANYTSSAFQIDHSKIQQQLSNLEEMERKQREIIVIDHDLDHLRDHIKGKLELEELFEKQAIEVGRTPGHAIAPVEQPEEPEVMNEEDQAIEITDSFEDFIVLSDEEVNQDRKARRKVIAVEPVKPSLWKRIFSPKIRMMILSALTATTIFSSMGGVITSAHATFNLDTEVDKAVTQVESQIQSTPATDLEMAAQNIADQIAVSTQQLLEISPSVGDKVHFNEGSKIYATSESAVRGIEGYDAVANGLGQEDLYVTRGALLDQNGSFLYMTTEYGADLRAIAQDMGLEDGSYQISLGCSVGDEKGDFVPVSMDQLNPSIEKGWINIEDPNVTVVEQLSSQLEKGGMAK